MGQAGDKRRNKEVAAVYHFSIFTTLLKKNKFSTLCQIQILEHTTLHMEANNASVICEFVFIGKPALELKEESFRQISRSPSGGSGHCEDPGGFHRIN